MCIFTVFSLINFAALALAPASILTPLESIQFVTNVFYGKFINKAAITYKMYLGVACTVVGTALSVIFGAPGGGCHSVEKLASFWTKPIWWTYLVTTIIVAAIAYAVHVTYGRRKRAGRPGPAHQIISPITFAISSALAGGAQMSAFSVDRTSHMPQHVHICRPAGASCDERHPPRFCSSMSPCPPRAPVVHSKVFSELLSLILQGNTDVFRSWVRHRGWEREWGASCPRLCPRD